MHPQAPNALVDDDDALLTDCQTAELLGVCTRTLWRWDALGDGPPSIKIGRKRRRRLKSIRRWLLNREGGGAA
jgi:hypothetical protein